MHTRKGDDAGHGTIIHLLTLLCTPHTKQPKASEMLRNDKIAQLLQQRQEKDAQQLNKASLMFHLAWKIL